MSLLLCGWGPVWTDVALSLLVRAARACMMFNTSSRYSYPVMCIKDIGEQWTDIECYSAILHNCDICNAAAVKGEMWSAV